MDFSIWDWNVCLVTFQFLACVFCRFSTSKAFFFLVWVNWQQVSNPTSSWGEIYTLSTILSPPCPCNSIASRWNCWPTPSDYRDSEVRAETRVEGMILQTASLTWFDSLLREKISHPKKKKKTQKSCQIPGSPWVPHNLCGQHQDASRDLDAAKLSSTLWHPSRFFCREDIPPRNATKRKTQINTGTALSTLHCLKNLKHTVRFWNLDAGFYMLVPSQRTLHPLFPNTTSLAGTVLLMHSKPFWKLQRCFQYCFEDLRRPLKLLMRIQSQYWEDRFQPKWWACLSLLCNLLAKNASAIFFVVVIFVLLLAILGPTYNNRYPLRSLGDLSIACLIIPKGKRANHEVLARFGDHCNYEVWLFLVSFLLFLGWPWFKQSLT